MNDTECKRCKKKLISDRKLKGGREIEHQTANDLFDCQLEWVCECECFKIGHQCHVRLSSSESSNWEYIWLLTAASLLLLLPIIIFMIITIYYYSILCLLLIYLNAKIRG